MLEVGSGPIPLVAEAGNPWGPLVARIDEGCWYSCRRADAPRLDRHGPTGHLSLVAWVRRRKPVARSCEFVAGVWNETAAKRQYGLFLNIRVWDEPDQVSAHVSQVGGPTPGYAYCIDAGTGTTPVACDRWSCVGMTYDGLHAAAWLDGRLDLRPGINPYALPGGLFDGGPSGADFTVGGVDRSASMGNFFCGDLGGLAVWDRALSVAEMRALAVPGMRGEATPSA